MPLTHRKLIPRLIAGLVVINLMVFAIAGIALLKSRRHFESVATTTTQNLAVSLAAEISGVLNKLDVGLLAIGGEVERQNDRHDINAPQLNAYVAHQRARLVDLEGIWVADANGNIRWGSDIPGSQPVNIADREYFQRLHDHAASGLVISKPVMGRITKAWSVLIARRINHRDGSFAGIVLGSLRVEDYFKGMFSRIDVGDQGLIMLRDDELALIARFARTTKQAVPIGAKITTGKSLDMLRAHPDSGTYTVAHSLDAIERLVSYQKVAGYPLYIFVSQSTHDIFLPWYNELEITLLLLLAFALGTIHFGRVSYKRTMETMEAHFLARRNEDLEQLVQSRTRELALAKEAAEEGLRAERLVMAAIVESSDDAIMGLTLDGTVATWNTSAQKMFGYSAQEMVGKSISKLTPPAHLAQEKLMLDAIQRGEPVRMFETERLCKDGRRIDVSSTVSPIRDNQGDIVGASKISRDITEQKRIERQLVESELLLNTLVHAIPDLVWFKDPHGIYLSCNTRFEQFIGLSEREITGKTDYDLVDRDLADFFRMHDQATLGKGGPSINEEWITFASDGHRELLETTKTPVRSEQGILLGVMGIGRDITERKRMEAALMESEVRYRTIIEWSPEPIGVHRHGHLLYVNPAAVKMFGAQSSAELIGIPVIHLVHPDSQTIALAREKNLYENSTSNPLIAQKYLRVDGTVIDVEVSSTKISYDAEPAILVAMRDVTERNRSEQMLRKLFTAIEQTPASIVITDLDACIEYVNPRFSEVTGYSLDEAIGQNPRILQSGLNSRQIYLELWDRLTSGHAWHGEFANKRKNGEIYWEEVHIAPVKNALGEVANYVAVKTDITAKKREREVLQLALKEKVGLLNEVHHRVKNNLQVISSLLRLEARRVPTPDAITVLNEMQGRVRSMALLHESLYRSGIFASVDLGKYLRQLVEQAFRMASSRAGAVRLELDLEPISVQLDQATPCGLIVNELVSNCLKHAFPQDASGVIKVGLQRIQGGPAVQIRVEDSGIGLSEDFETRQKQSLGLLLVRDLVTQIGGQLTVTSVNGTRFEVNFDVKS